MIIKPLHEWNVSPQQAVELQKQLALEVIREDRFNTPVKTVAGLDLGYDIKTNTSRAVVAILSFPSLEFIESSEAIFPTPFPYIPGLLSFREVPVAIKALEKLKNPPDLILVDGQGIAHPRRFGIASHVGLVADLPTIGVAKSILVGWYKDLAETRGSTAELIHKGERIGVALRTKDKVYSPFSFRSATVSVSNPLSITS